MKIKVYHHNDPDGYCSKFWFDYFYKKYFSSNSIEYEEYNYQKIENIEQVNDQSVFFLDCSPEDPKELKQLQAQGNEIIIIDHHITSYNKYKNIKDIELFYDIKHSGCELTRLYFERKFDVEVGYQKFSELVEDWDIWKFEMEDTEAFIFGLQSDDIKDMKVWEGLLYEGHFKINDYIKKGKAILAFRDNMAALVVERTGLVINFHGFSCFALNNALPSAKWFLDNAKKYDCLLNWCVNKYGKISASLYSEHPEKVQAGKLLEKYYNGGGHDGAAGCVIDIDKFFKEILIFKEQI